ncbi:Cysteine desulfurase, SufS subfamily [Clostridiaceae bacterium JG1575]|nr:Cysteine desulfurase, SufS subfamily [Clostridiaceae bacterium JG1575]
MCRRRPGRAHEVGAVLVCDGSQAVGHLPVRVEELGVDFYVFTGHKIMALNGAGVVYGRRDLLEEMDPFLLGGDMIEYVQEQSATFNTVPYKFEAGTPLSEAVISLGAALDYLEERVGFERIQQVDRELTGYLLAGLANIPEITILGGATAQERTGIITFTLEGVHAHDVAQILSMKGICVRSGHHCAQPLAKFCGASSSTRVSLWFYNTKEDCDVFLTELSRVRRLMGLGVS